MLLSRALRRRSTIRAPATSGLRFAYSVVQQRVFTTTKIARVEREDMADVNGFEKMEEAGLPKAEKSSAAAKPAGQEQELPKLSAADFRAYNRMAEHMDQFHSHFRQTWNMLYTACTTSKKPAGMSLRSFLSAAEQFSHQLTFHHTIEEQHIFPVLATKMPKFRKELELLTQHKQIHEGLEELEKYIGECRSGERELRFVELKGVMDGFGAVLWEHLDDEVRELGAQNMRRYWSLAEMRRLPM